MDSILRFISGALCTGELIEKQQICVQNTSAADSTEGCEYTIVLLSTAIGDYFTDYSLALVKTHIYFYIDDVQISCDGDASIGEDPVTCINITRARKDSRWRRIRYRRHVP
jgi:hypothetical protein